MRQLRSLGQVTEIALLRMAGSEVLDRGDYLCMRTPQNPTFHWGNWLLYRSAPRKDEFLRWTEDFKAEFASLPHVKHMTFGWDDPSGASGDLAPFQAAGFVEDRAVVLTASSVHASTTRSRSSHPIKQDIRPLQTDHEWQDLIDLQFLCRDPKYAAGPHRLFVERRYTAYRTMVNQGFGQWHGAFIGAKLVATLGLFFEKDAGDAQTPSRTIGRFQNVATHPDYRRQGLCANLVYQISHQSLEEKRAAVLVMLADPGYHAARIYESVGFKPTERLSGIVLAGAGTLTEKR